MARSIILLILVALVAAVACDVNLEVHRQQGPLEKYLSRTPTPTAHAWATPTPTAGKG